MNDKTEEYIEVLKDQILEEYEENQRVASAIKSAISFEVLNALVLEVLKEDLAFLDDINEDHKLKESYTEVIKYYSIPSLEK